MSTQGESYSSKSDGVSFERDVKPFFTQIDRDHMVNEGLFDLWVGAEVCENYDQIRDALSAFRMPIPVPWTPEHLAEFLAVFDPWKKGGCQP